MNLKCPYCKTEFPPQDECKCPSCGKFVNIPQHLRPSFKAPKRKKTSREEREEHLRRRTMDTGFSGKAQITTLTLIIFLIVGTIQVLTRTSDEKPAQTVERPSWKPKLARHQMERIRTALEFYKLDCYRYPPKDMGLSALVRDMDIITWKGPYVINMRLSDPWLTDYVYDVTEDGEVVLFSCGPDRKAGTDDDIPSPPPLPLENYDPSLKKETPSISLVHEDASNQVEAAGLSTNVPVIEDATATNSPPDIEEEPSLAE